MGSKTAPGLRKNDNLSDLRSLSAARSNLMDVTSRPPTGSDITGYVPGQSLWISPDGRMDQLLSVLPQTPTMPNGMAAWMPFANPGPHAGNLVAGAVFAGWTRRIVSTWTGNLFQVTRATDGATLNIATLPNGDPDVSALVAFLVPSLGIGYVSILYDQSGNGNNATQTLIGCMPRIDTSIISGVNIPIEFDSGRRAYFLGLGSYDGVFPVTWTSGNTVTLNGAQATCTGSISGTTMTLTGTVAGTVSGAGWFVIGQQISGGTTAAGTTIVEPITGESQAGTYQVTPSQTVLSTTLTASWAAPPPDIQPGVYVTGTNIPNAVFTATTIGTTITVVSLISGAPVAGMTLNGALDGTVLGSNISGSGVGSTWNINVSQTNTTAISITGYTTITAANLTTGVVTLSCAPTGTPGNLTFRPNNVYLNLPSAVQVPLQSFSVITAMSVGTDGFGYKPWILGVQGNDGAAPAKNFAGPLFESAPTSDNWGMRLNIGGNYGSATLQNDAFQVNPQVYAVSTGGTGGKTCISQFAGIQNTTSLATIASATLSGGAIGGNLQPSGGLSTGGDILFYGILIYPSSIAFSDINNFTASVNYAHGWSPQVYDAIVADGSSTTAGAGTLGALSWPTCLGTRLGRVSPKQIYNATRGANENGIVTFPFGAALVPNAQKKLLIVHWGLGNSIQLGGTFAVTAQSGNVLTIGAGIGNSAIAGVNLNVSGTNIPAGTTTIAANLTTNQVTLSNTPTGAVTSIVVSGSTPTSFWKTMQLYLAQAQSYGFNRVVMIGSCTRAAFGTYPNAFLSTFNAIKTYMRENWQNLAPNLIGFIDWEDLPQFGDDGGTMVVTGISGQVITVNSPTAFVQPGSRVRWSGMLGNAAQIAAAIAAGTGGQFITAASGNTMTALNPILGLSVGQTIRAINPAPWTNYPQYMNWDHQHFSKVGYFLQGDVVAQYLLNNNLLS